MKLKYLLFILSCICAIPSFSQLNSQSQSVMQAASNVTPGGCGAQVTQQQIIMEQERDQLGYQQLIQSLINNPPETKKEFIIQLHLLRNDDGSHPSSITLAQIRNEITNYVNPYFNTPTLNASFVECGPPIIHNSTTYNSLSSRTEGDAMSQAYNVPNVINIYFVDYALGFCGWANFPSYLPKDYIVMKYSCAINQSTLVHELGHYFDLYHTHETAFGAESVTRVTTDVCYNANTAGDKLHDTQADPVLSGRVNSSCSVTLFGLGPCNQTYMPDPNNIMSYSVKACRTIFSLGQQARMAASMSNERSYLDLLVAPIAKAKNVVVNLNSAGNANVSSSQVDNGSTAECGIASLSVSPSSFNCSNVGQNTVTLSVTDNGGNTTTANAIVTVVDNTSPVITCPANISINNDPGVCGAIVTYAAPTASDNCGLASFLQTSGLSSGSVFPLGTTTNTFLATDASGNPASCSFTVTVSDMEDPVITCPSPISVANDPGQCGAVVNFTTTVIDNCPGVTVVTNPASGSFFNVGSTTVTSTATDAAGNTATCAFTVTVSDMEDPIVTCPAPISVANDPGQCGAIVNFSPTITDNCPGTAVVSSPVSGSLFPVGLTTVTSVATDAAGNTSSCSFTVTVNDTEDPVIACVPDFAVCDGSTVTYTIPTASDNCPGVAVAQIDGSGLSSGDVFPLGTTTLKYTATDAFGNAATCSFNVTVNPNPVVSITSAPAANSGGGGTFGGMDTTIVWDYGAQSLQLGVTVSGGSSFSYSWIGNTADLSDPTIANPVFTPTTAGIFDYTLVVTNNATGCQSTATQSLVVIDARCGKNNNKILMCHNGKTICVSPNAVPAHLANHSGDYFGACSNKSDISGDVELKAYPTPSSGIVHLEFEVAESGNVTIEVLSSIGQLVHGEQFQGGIGHHVHSLDLSDLASGVYLVRLTQNGNTDVQRIQIRK